MSDQEAAYCGNDPQTGEPIRDRPVTVVLIESISYTGTTWINFVLGSHERALPLGPADRALQNVDEPAQERSFEMFDARSFDK